MRSCSEKFPDLFEGGTYAGVDEVGRGALAGPLVVAAVHVPDNVILQGVDDSKKLKFSDIRAFATRIKERCYYSLSFIHPVMIDDYKMNDCIKLAFSSVIEELNGKTSIDGVVFDGSYVPLGMSVNAVFVEKADSKFLEVACASILAKYERDVYMAELAKKHPGYGWEKNVGYGIKEHIEAIKELGPAVPHRKSFISHITPHE